MVIVILNVGGVRYQTLLTTIKKDGVSNLANEDFLAEHYCADTEEYFFDRDPDVFKATLNYLRTGYLHLPSYICGPAAKRELEFWGVEPSKIERCCWLNYNEWNSTLDALKQFEHDRKRNISVTEELRRKRGSCWSNWRFKIWQYISGYNTSIPAKVIDIFSLCFVLLAIFTFMAETTPPFYAYKRQPVKNISASNTTLNPARLANGTATALSNVTAATVTNTTDAGHLTTTVQPGVLEEQFIEVRVDHPVLAVFDLICLAFFTLEYIIRLTFAPRKLKHVTSLLAIIDLLAILPDYIEIIVYAIKPSLQAESSVAVEFMSTLRVVRVLRIFRLIRHVPGLWILVYTLRASLSELMLLVWFMSLGMLFFSSLIYFTEDREHFKSIPDGFWWALITMTTVGYGDMYPHTYPGKVVGSFCAMAGVLMIGFTVPALVNNFMLYYKHVQFALHAEECKPDTDDVKDVATNDVDVTLDVSSHHSLSSHKSAQDSKENGMNKTARECIPLVEVKQN